MAIIEQVNLKLPVKVKEDLKVLSRKKDKSMVQLIKEMIERLKNE